MPIQMNSQSISSLVRYQNIVFTLLDMGATKRFKHW
ncbi:hypothetical protein I3842_11G116100 [Carya illinoinensis]|uniref:Uncharacterized protein n=1 Tax=Carya illinoinensis TaxID=32201 RepID=A0A922DQ41_CARIL|nr:hypothetical protein I3842_11G116100 [Carya illinoinensis]